MPFACDKVEKHHDASTPCVQRSNILKCMNGGAVRRYSRSIRGVFSIRHVMAAVTCPALRAAIACGTPNPGYKSRRSWRRSTRRLCVTGYRRACAIVILGGRKSVFSAGFGLHVKKRGQEMVARGGPIREANQDSAAARRVRIGQSRFESIEPCLESQ